MPRDVSGVRARFGGSSRRRGQAGAVRPRASGCPAAPCSGGPGGARVLARVRGAWERGLRGLIARPRLRVHSLEGLCAWQPEGRPTRAASRQAGAGPAGAEAGRGRGWHDTNCWAFADGLGRLGRPALGQPERCRRGLQRHFDVLRACA